ncbi:class I SAM-dependent methyltransferase [Sphingomonas pituitosa]|uniref:class I SAM-dependent methyltransferase n=1 Tax=Sphingomonas pituitosa TaxID=99597 RepID=UPI00082AB528|nr:class I SAM-dependent methyltransferase [Sphingomonas pituitosa]
MTDTDTLAPSPIDPLPSNDPLALASFNQNFETFRALNALMWQIPLIAMTLTGGLWFGVSSIKDMALMRSGLLLLAGLGDLGLMIVLSRLRHIIGCYLDWINAAFPRGFVSARGTSWGTRSETVKTTFQLMLLSAAIISFVLFCGSMTELTHPKQPDARAKAIAWYDTHATRIADGYEGLEAQETHPRLFAALAGSKPLRILDVGAGTGRDAAALSALGHQVTAVEPSAKMLRLARAIHADDDVDWVADAMPELTKAQGQYDLITLSAVWMHVPPADRDKAFHRLTALLAPGGRLYFTLRLGPAEPERALWTNDAGEIRDLAAGHRLKVEDWGKRPDLLGRDAVHWQTLLLTKTA